jgi:hypothetical protein
LEALRGDRLDNVRLLLKAKADPNKSGRDGVTPLMSAIARKKHPIMTRLLLKEGADLFIEARDGQNMFHAALAYTTFKDTGFEHASIIDVESISWLNKIDTGTQILSFANTEKTKWFPLLTLQMHTVVSQREQSYTMNESYFAALQRLLSSQVAVVRNRIEKYLVRVIIKALSPVVMSYL